MKKHEGTSVRLTAMGMAAMLMAGCASMSDSQKTTAQGAGMGSLIGAIAGGVIGHQSGSRDAGILVGGLVGAAAGAAYGNHVAGKKEQFASEEDYLDAVLAQAEQVRDDARRQNRELQAEIVALDQEVTDTLAAYATNQASREDALALKKSLEDRLATADTRLGGIQDEIRIQKEVLHTESDSADRERLQKLEQTIAELEDQKSELTAQAEQLADLGGRISV